VLQNPGRSFEYAGDPLKQLLGNRSPARSAGAENHRLARVLPSAPRLVLFRNRFSVLQGCVADVLPQSFSNADATG